MRTIKRKRIINLLTASIIGLTFFSSAENTFTAHATSGLITYENVHYPISYQKMLDSQEGRGVIYHSANSNRKATRDEIEIYLNPTSFLQFIPGIYTHSNNGTNLSLKTIKINSNHTSLYKEANDSSPKLNTVSKNQVYVVLDDKTNFYKINRNGIFGWVNKADIEYTNGAPRDMYQFILLSEPSGITKTQMDSELKGKGILDGMGKAYIDAGRKYNVNEIYLLGHSLLETGHGTSQLAQGVLVDEVDGKKVPPKITYNMFGIGAYDNNAIKAGSERAYKLGWFTPEAAIEGGAKWISDNYIHNVNYKQNTIYKMRWNPVIPWKQYATDVAWGYKQTRNMDIFEEVVNRNNIQLKFDIPTYVNFYDNAQWKLFGGEWYLLDHYGLAQLGWQELDNHIYYMANSGIMQIDWHKIDNNWYYFNTSGQMQTGWLNDKDAWYYLSTKGTMQTGWLKNRSTWYHLAGNGVMQTGWRKINNNWYYLNTTGGMITGWLNFNDGWYYMSSEGSMQIGWLEDRNEFYYFDTDGSMLNGWQKLENNWYYFNNNGTMKTGWTSFNGSSYYMSKEGLMHTGWLKDSGEWYYFSAEGSMLTGWQEINNKWYYFNDSGEMLKNTMIEGHKLDTEGAVIGDWVYSNGNWYYSVKDSKVTGWKKVNDNWYYLGAEGIMVTGWLNLGSNKYFLNKNGSMATGWQNQDGNWYYFNQSGVMQKNTKVDGHRLDQEGVLIGDWQRIDGNWYFYVKDTKVTGWLVVDSNRYYLNSNGVMLNNWQYIESNWYYFNSSGEMARGWVKLENNWYYLNDHGEMKTGWLEINGVWYYLKQNGSMVTGEQVLNGNIYRFNENGVWLK